MPDISATEAARAFSRLLDDVEHEGRSFTVVRHGRPVAQIEPVSSGSGAVVKEMMRRHRPDRQWRDDLAATRAVLELDDRT